MLILYNFFSSIVVSRLNKLECLFFQLGLLLARKALAICLEESTCKMLEQAIYSNFILS